MRPPTRRFNAADHREFEARLVPIVSSPTLEQKIRDLPTADSRDKAAAEAKGFVDTADLGASPPISAATSCSPAARDRLILPSV
jgi:hypothetical protein